MVFVPGTCRSTSKPSTVTFGSASMPRSFSRFRMARSARLLVPALPCLQLERSLEWFDRAAPRAAHGLADASLVEPAPEVSLVDEVCEFVVRPPFGEVDEQPRDRGDRDALVHGPVARIEPACLVESNALGWHALTRKDDIDHSGAPPPEPVELLGG